MNDLPRIDGPKDVAYTGGEVLMEARDASASAILVRDGKIAAVGSDDEIRSAAGRAVEVHDLDGATVSPGLIDSHPHLMHLSLFKAPLVDITGAGSHDDIVAALRTRAATTPAGEWICTTPVGEPQYFVRRSYRDLAEGTLPDRHTLDRGTDTHPVMIQAWAPTTPNVCAVNSAALRALGIDRTTPDRVSNVWIEKDAGGEPTGILRGSVNAYYNDDPFFLELIGRMPPLMRPELAVQATVQGMAEHNARGITTIFEAHAMEPAMVDLYRALRAQDLLTLRVQTSYELEGNALPELQPKSMAEIHATLETALAGRELEDDWLRIDGVTTCAWGPAGCGRLWWPEGYTGPWGERTTGNRATSAEKIAFAVDFCARTGLRLNALALSPAEHDEYIALTEEAMRRYGLDRTGWLIEHGYFLREDQPKRYADLGFDMTISIGHTFGKGDMLAERIGPDALPLLNPLRTLLDAGLNVGACMDWGPDNPFEAMRMALTHQMFPSGRFNNGPAQVISRAEAFQMWTTGGAKALGWDGIGTLRVGAHADLAVLDRNPITCDIDSLPETQVLRTTVGGRVVHDSGALASTGSVAAPPTS
ncbi:amidohydrolase [Nocardia sp. CA-084685]|uniref:amidohydrolase n=1 Tax=Nocardia sp. CA-084685 TaxID=3239970 RepID=UPI003D975AD0